MPFIVETTLTPTEQSVITDASDFSPEPCLTNEMGTPLKFLRPIMARLPNFDMEEEEIDFSDEYFSATKTGTTPGTLRYTVHHEHIKYTRSRLPDIDKAGQELWASLHDLRPLTTSYAGNFQSRSRAHTRNVSNQTGCPMKKSSSSSLDLVRRVFNWDQLTLPEHTDAEFYGVIFRSKRSEGSDTEQLMLADKLSHEEAVTSGGLLMYWYGVPDPTTGSNLATCIWRGRSEARKASSLPLHRKAAKLAANAYEDFELSRYKVVKKAGEVGISIVEWDD